MKHIIVSIIIICEALFCHTQAQEPAKGYHLQKDISYLHTGETDAYKQERCRLDLYYPADKKDFATLVWFHGGGLKAGEKHFPKEFLNQGYAVIAVNYRLSPRAENPAYTEDAAEAVAWTFENIRQFGGNPDKIYISGHSAGGYLTLMLNLDKSYLGKWGIDADRIAGAFPISGQTTTHYTIRKERGLPSDIPIIDKYAPSNNVRKDASPMILITGDKELEMLARYEENAHLYALLKALGQKVTFYEMEGFDHVSVAAPACILINRQMKKNIREYPPFTNIRSRTKIALPGFFIPFFILFSFMPTQFLFLSLFSLRSGKCSAGRPCEPQTGIFLMFSPQKASLSRFFRIFACH